MNETVDLDVFHCFLDEALDSFADLGSKVLSLETASNYKELLEAIFRPVHGIKGNAGFFELTNLLRVSHKLEDLLQDLRSGRLAVNREVVDILIEGIDILTDTVHRVRKEPAASDLSRREKEYIEKIAGYRSKKIAVFDLICTIQSLTDMLALVTRLGVDPGALPHASQVEESVTLLIQDIKDVLGGDEQKAANPNASYALKGKDLTKQVHILFDVMNCLREKKAISSELVKSFTASFYEILNELDRSLQGTIDLSQAESLFPFMDDSFLNQASEFITEIELVVSAVIRHLECSAAPGEVKKIGEILVAKGKITESDLADSLKKQKRLGQILLEDEKIEKEDLAEALAEQSSQVVSNLTDTGKLGKDARTIRVQQDKIDEFAFCVGELTMSLGAMEHIYKDLNKRCVGDEAVRNLKGVLETVNDVTGNLENAVMEIRRVPAKTVLRKLPTLVRTLSRNMDKEITTEISGEDVLVDKDTLEKMEDPLIHLIRNSVDHGIETSIEERVSKGKAQQGKIAVCCRSDGAFFYLDVIDDGQGIDPDKMRASACQKGFLAEDEASKLSDQEAMYLIFRSGFSSAKEISDISGRGVGLDVVRNNVEKLGGTFAVDSRVGSGTEFHMKVPQTKTLVTKQALFIEDHGKVFAVPSAQIESVVDLRPDQLRADDGCMIAVIKDTVCSFKKLNDCLDSRCAGSNQASKDGWPDRICGLILRKQKIGILVEKVLHFGKIVVKDSEDGLTGGIPVLEGFTIRGDGQVVSVLKLDKILSA